MLYIEYEKKEMKEQMNVGRKSTAESKLEGK